MAESWRVVSVELWEARGRTFMVAEVRGEEEESTLGGAKVMLGVPAAFLVTLVGLIWTFCGHPSSFGHGRPLWIGTQRSRFLSSQSGSGRGVSRAEEEPRMRWPWVIDEVRAEVVVSLVEVARVRMTKVRRVRMMESFILIVLMSS